MMEACNDSAPETTTSVRSAFPLDPDEHGANAALTGRPLCFFDPRHGPSVNRVAWAPPGGAPRDVDVCAADAVRLTEGLPPIATGVRPAPAPAPVRPKWDVPSVLIVRLHESGNVERVHQGKAVRLQEEPLPG